MCSSALSLLVLISLVTYRNVADGEECGTRFTDFTSSVVLAEVVLQGSVNVFNPTHFANNVRSANVSVSSVYKGMDVLKSTGRMDGNQQVVIQSFGQKRKEDCVAADDDSLKNQDMVFFLRQSPDRRMMEHSALPLPAEGNEEQRVKRSLCDTCIHPPNIRRLVCKDCAKKPMIKTMKSKKTTMGRKARLRCNARGKPAPKISWFKNNVPIMSGNGGVTIRSTALSSTLMFTKTTSAHGGRYKCVASNEMGEVEDFVVLDVSRKKPRKKPEKAKPYSVKDAPDRVRCVANPCMNGGMCFFSPSLNLRQCVCTSGFEGVKCENIDSINTVQNNTNVQRTVTSTTETPPTASKSSSILEKDKMTDGNVTETPTPSSRSLPTTLRSGSSSVNKQSSVPNRIPVSSVNKPVNPQTSNNIYPSINKSRSRFTPASSKVKPRPTSRYSVNGEKLPSFPVRKKSGLKIITCRDKLFCQNKGKCKYISKLNKKFCQCRKGYGGIRCERVLF